ncbi:hypothetical protein [Streptomyces sp. NPDC127114]|uniref:hypothetical protein n=1 Tax=Streptomyces sp. NPDC127114 TaxID=3345366 RepID=UPI00362578A5
MSLALPELREAPPLDRWSHGLDALAHVADEHLMRRVLAGLKDIDADKTVDADLILVQEAFETPPPPAAPEREARKRARALHGVLERRIREARHRGLLLDNAAVTVIQRAEAVAKATFADPYAALRRYAVAAEALLELLGT